MLMKSPIEQDLEKVLRILRYISAANYQVATHTPLQTAGATAV
jgi:hypothetical protein